MSQEEKEKYLHAYKYGTKAKNKEKSVKITVKKVQSLEENKDIVESEN